MIRAASFLPLFLAVTTANAQPVRVILDLDASRPGIQNFVRVPAGTTLVQGVAMYIYDPQGTRRIDGIGFVGGIDRGISIGHMPSNAHVGTVTGLVGHAGTPATLGGSGFLSGLVQKGCQGPELHYIESGPAQSLLPAAPLAPVCTVDVQLSGAVNGDVFRVSLLDMVTVWRGGTGGAFSAQGSFSFDSGGDCVPDGTPSMFGPDPDVAAPSPPATFQVDYIDGQGGGRIVVVPACYANCDNTGGLTANDFQCFIDRFIAGAPYANCDGSTGNPELTGNDFMCFVNAYVQGCP
jgi:hypothetical protein